MNRDARIATKSLLRVSEAREEAERKQILEEKLIQVSKSDLRRLSFSLVGGRFDFLVFAACFFFCFLQKELFFFLKAIAKDHCRYYLVLLRHAERRRGGYPGMLKCS